MAKRRRSKRKLHPKMKFMSECTSRGLGGGKMKGKSLAQRKAMFKSVNRGCVIELRKKFR